MKNNTGIKPIQGRVLVLPDEIDEAEGLVIKPLVALEREAQVQIMATIIDHGEDCFTYEDGVMWSDAPEVGDKVIMSRYAGVPIFEITKDTNNRNKAIEYRLCNDTDIVAIRTEDKEIRSYE
jgi:co-chaperonin GroES (HSP10)